MEAVDILGRVDTIQNRCRVNCGRQRKLHQDAVHFRIEVEPVHQAFNLRLRGVFRQLVGLRAHAELGRGLCLRAHIDPRGRVIANQHHVQARGYPALAESRHLARHIVADLACDLCSIELPLKIIHHPSSRALVFKSTGRTPSYRDATPPVSAVALTSSRPACVSVRHSASVSGKVPTEAGR